MAVWLVAIIAVPQLVLAATCYKQRLVARGLAAAGVCFAVSQVLVAAFAEPLFELLHTPSSFDAVADGFEIQLRAFLAIVGAAGVSVMVQAAILWTLLRGKERSCEARS